MEEAVLQAIRDIEAKKKEVGEAPDFATRRELERVVSDALNSLYAQQKIAVGVTANDKWIKAIP